MRDVVENAAKKLGPCISSDLVEALVRTAGLSPEAARQRVSRSVASNRLLRVRQLPLPKNAMFVYLAADYGSPKYWRSLIDVLMTKSVSYGRALASVIARQGIMPLSHFEIACGSPIAQRGHQSYATVLANLERAGLIQRIEVEGIGTCLQIAHYFTPGPEELREIRARLKTESILLFAVKDWLRKLGMVSYEKAEVRGDAVGASQPRVGTFRWDLTAPSYVGAVVERTPSSVKPGFVACDVLLGKEITVDALRPFIAKCEMLRTLNRVGRCVQIFVADSFDKAALKLAKEKGVIPATPAALFGQDVAEALVRLSDMLVQTTAAAGDAKKVDDLLSKLGKIEGAAGNLRGALFEFICAEVVRSTSAVSDLRMNQVFRDGDGRGAEVDVVSVMHHQSVRFLECRGYHPAGEISDDEVKRWLETRIPLVRKVALTEQQWAGYSLKFELWTTGTVSVAAKARIREAQQNVSPTKYTIELVDRDKFETEVAKTRSKALRKTVDEHFLKHPLAPPTLSPTLRARRRQVHNSRPHNRVRSEVGSG